MTADPTLLVIDDSATIRKLVELSFATSRWRLVFATTGRDGIDLAGRCSPAAILLDYVLPDMRGTDVCSAIADIAALARVPILVMSAKTDGGRAQFAGFSTISDFIIKPFSATDIVVRVNRACERQSPREPASSAGSSHFDFARKQATAQAIYEKLRPQLGHIPEWLPELGAQPAAAFFSRKLLTVSLIDELYAIFARELMGVAVSELALPPIDGAEFRGELGAFPLLDLLRLLATQPLPGLLELRCPEQRVLVYLQDGAIAHVTSDSPELYLRGATGLPALRPELRAAAEDEQRKTCKPALFAWGEAGAITQDELGQRMAEHGRRLLVSVSRGHSSQFGWVSNRRAPPELLRAAAPISLASVNLELLRQQAAWSEVERSPAWSDAAFERAPLFSQKLVDLGLTASERDVLSLIDGERGCKAIGAVLNLPPKLVAAILYRLLSADLIRTRVVAPRAAPPAPILVLDPDEESFVAPLKELLAGSTPPAKVISLSRGDSVTAAIERESPGLVLINASVEPERAVRAALDVRSRPELNRARLVALLDAPATDAAMRLETLGYERVLVKPLLRSDVEGLINR